MWLKRYRHELYHYGVKGMKWGVRRTPEQLGRQRDNGSSIKASNGVTVKIASIHATNRSKERNARSEDIIDALKNPLHVGDVKIDEIGRPSQRYVGRGATVNVNPTNGVITTVWVTGRHTVAKYSKKGD